MATKRPRRCRCSYPGPGIHTEATIDITGTINKTRYVILVLTVFLAILIAAMSLFAATGFASITWLIVAVVQLLSGITQFRNAGRTINAMLVTAERLDDDRELRAETDERVAETRDLLEKFGMSTGSGIVSDATPDVRSG